MFVGLKRAATTRDSSLTRQFYALHLRNSVSLHVRVQTIRDYIMEINLAVGVTSTIEVSNTAYYDGIRRLNIKVISTFLGFVL